MVLKQSCKVAVIGAGYTAREHVRAFADVPGVVLAGIHSRTRSRADGLAKEFSILSVHDSVAELYAGTQADLVVVTVPELSMRGVSTACFEYPWTVLLEKPAGYNIADARAIKDAAEARNRKVLVALNRRFYASTQAVRDDVASVEAPRFIKVQDQQDQKAALAAGQPQAVVDNWMFANSIHLVDYLRMFGRGKVIRVEPVIAWDPGHPGVVVAKVIFDSGDMGVYEGIWDGPGPWAVTVNTPAKRWELRPLEQAAFQNKGERKIQPVEQHVWDQTFKPGFRLQAEEAVAAALDAPSCSITLADAFETMLLVQSVFSINDPVDQIFDRT